MRESLRSRLLVGVFASALALTMTACGGGSGGSGGSSGSASGQAASGSISIEGSSTVQPITQAAAELFSQENPDAKISVGGAGTSDGFEAFCKGDTQISDASRPIDPKEEAPVCKKNGIEYVELEIAYDGISVVVNKQNTFAKDVTSAELKTLWEPSAEGKITKWSQVRSSWPAEKVNLYGPGTESGTFDFFTDTINGEEGASRTDYEASEDDNVLVQGVSGDKDALGYFGYSYYENNTDTLRALKVDDVAPTPDTIRSGDYPLSRPLFVYVNVKDLENNATVKSFMDFYIAEENLDRLVKAAKYITLPADIEAKTRSTYEDRKTGSAANAE